MVSSILFQRKPAWLHPHNFQWRFYYTWRILEYSVKNISSWAFLNKEVFRSSNVNVFYLETVKHFEEGCKSAVIWKYFKLKKKLGFHQGKPSRFWERKTLPCGSSATANVVTALKILILFSDHAICLRQKKRSSRVRPFPVASLFLLLSTLLLIWRIQNVFNLGFACIILLRFCFTSAATSTLSFR